MKNAGLPQPMIQIVTKYAYAAKRLLLETNCFLEVVALL